MNLTCQNKELDTKQLQSLNSRVMGVLRKDFGNSLVTQSELLEWMQFGKESEKLECSSNKECMVSISNQANSDLVFGGKVGKVGKVGTVNLYILDNKKAETLSRASGEAASISELEEAAVDAVKRLIKDMNQLGNKLSVSISELGKNPQIAIMDFTASGVDKALAKNITDVVTVELKQFEGFKIISRQEIAALLDFEAVKQGMGCDDEGCFAEIGNALGVGFLVVGSIGFVEKTYIINIKVMDMHETKIIGREQENFVGPADGLLPAARFCLRRVFGSPYKGDGLMKMSVNEKKADVSINGKSFGLYPDLKLPNAFAAGKYRIEVSKDDYYPIARDIYVEPARQTQVQFVLKEEPPEWWETWWFWTTVGVVVAGGVTTGAVLGTMSGDSPDSGKLDIKVQ